MQTTPKSWIARAIEERNPKLPVWLAASIPHKIDSVDKDIIDREMTGKVKFG